MNVINVEIKNKKAVRTDDTAYTCDNSKYTVVFSFDEEWDEFEVKTARFVYGDKYQDVVFTGNECEMPIISDTKLISVGVYAGNLQTTTPALIVANKSILSDSGTPEPPSEDVYSQIIQMIDDGMIKGDKGDQGPKGDTPQKGVDYWTEKDKAEITEYIDEQTSILKSDIEGIQEDMQNEAHFRGYLSTNAKIQALDATPNDFAYSAESGTKWVYDAENGWQDTNTPVPDQLTPASDAIPLVNGVASAGQVNEYSRGDHRHPTDETRASVEDLKKKADKPKKVIIDGGILDIEDNTIYETATGQAINNLHLSYPVDDFIASLTFTLADEGVITIMFPDSKYIGATPTFANGETWELNIMNGVVVGGLIE